VAWLGAAAAVLALAVAAWTVLSRDRTEPAPPAARGAGGPPNGQAPRAEKRPEGHAAGEPARRQDFALKVTLLGDGKRSPKVGDCYRLQDGQQFELEIEPAASCYLLLWYVMEDGKILQLFPNERDKARYFAGGKKHLLPGPDDEAAYGVRAGKGRERIHLAAATSPWPEGSVRVAGREGPFAVFPQRRGEGVVEAVTGLRPAELLRRKVRVAEVVLPVEVVPAAGN
jgi:hypothetical protein